MRGVRERAATTPPWRERYVDLLRAVAICLVVLGHWLISVVDYDNRGRPTGHSALEALSWGYPITWIVQVIPLFFLVGGYANAASLTSNRRRGGGAISWLQDRTARLVRPTTALMLVLAACGLIARGLHADPEFIRMAVWVASIPLWFLAAYLVAVLATPVMYKLHQRFGWRVLPVLVVLVALGDGARLSGAAPLGAGNFLFGWLAFHQLGFAWRDGQLQFRPRTWVPLLFGGLAILAGLTYLGPYSVSMVDVSGPTLQNASPPTLALLAMAAFQLGLVVLLHDAAERWLHRPWPWRGVVALNAVVLTIFLWHMSAVVLLVGLLNALHVLPTPIVGTRDWWLWRLPWLAMLIVVLVILVAIFGRLELRPRQPRPRSRPMPGLTGAVPVGVLTVVAFAAVIAGLLFNSLAPRTGDYLFGMPLAAILTYLAGAGVLRLLRSLPTSGRGPTRP
jgi:fucose 4-O-acetylase-like acetyltransferase